MLVLMKPEATETEIRAVFEAIEAHGCSAHVVNGTQRAAIGWSGKGKIDPSTLDVMSGVAEVVRVNKPYMLASREFQPQGTVIDFGDGATVGGRDLMIIAGVSCATSREQVLSVASSVAATGVRFLRVAAHPCGVSTETFTSVGPEILSVLAEARQKFGLKIVAEAVDETSLGLIDSHADVIEVGSRNMQNFALLKRVGRASKPILLKRGMSSTVEEFLLAAEYLLSEGTRNVILCERGVRTFAEHSRSILDLSVVPALRKLTHLPIIVDPSHSAGDLDQVAPLARAAVAAGCDGLVLRVDGAQAGSATTAEATTSLRPDEVGALIEEVRQIAGVLSRTVPHSLNKARMVTTS